MYLNNKLSTILSTHPLGINYLYYLYTISANTGDENEEFNRVFRGIGLLYIYNLFCSSDNLQHSYITRLLVSNGLC